MNLFRRKLSGAGAVIGAAGVATTAGAATKIAAALVTVHPGGTRETRWRPDAGERQDRIEGTAQRTVFNAGPQPATTNLNPGDTGCIRRSTGHYVKNTGDI